MPSAYRCSIMKDMVMATIIFLVSRSGKSQWVNARKAQDKQTSKTKHQGSQAHRVRTRLEMGDKVRIEENWAMLKWRIWGLEC